MKTFSNQVELTAHFEGFSAKAYKCPAGVWTFGFGTTRIGGKPITEGMTCTQAEALKWLEKDLGRAKTDIKTKGVIVASSTELDAMADYAYNCGVNAFPSLIACMKRADRAGASLEFLDSIYVAKTPLLGLLLRRISEYNTFVNGTYIAWEKGDAISQDLKNKLLAKNAKNQDAVVMINQLRVK